MKETDLKYLTTSLSQLSGIPVRIYKNNKLIFFSSIVKLVKDPFILDEINVLSNKENIGYYINKDFFIYCYINYKNYKILIGPSREIKPNDELLSKLAFNLEIEKDNLIEFKSSMRNIVSMPLESILQSLCMFNYILNKDKKTVKEIIIDENKIVKIDSNLSKENPIEEKNVNYEHNTKNIEDDILKMVKYGEIEELKDWIKNAPAIRSGLMSNDSLRQIKNTFIVSATLVSRAAISGMLDVNEALTLSDLYIQKMELLYSQNEIITLQMNMLLDFTSKVSKIRGKKETSTFLISLNKYIYNHISDAIKVKDICSSLYISKSVLFEKLKKETNKTVSEYILNIKINEAKYLLIHSNKNISSISLYLGFSSQSHFNKVFKEYTSITPNEFKREKTL